MTPCYNCPTIEQGTCLLGHKCKHHNKQNIEAEIERRNKERAERLRARADKLVRGYRS